MTEVRARTTTGTRSGLRYLIYSFGLLLALLGASCGNSVYSVGTVLVTLHSKPGRFTSYVVYLAQIQLTRQDGAVIALPFLRERVDLANTGGNIHLLGAPPVAVGTYTAATFVLDYSSLPSAVVTVNNGGAATNSATLVDESTATAPVTESITVRLDPTHPFVVNDQRTQELNLSIDLEASHIIGAVDANNNVAVTVKPFWSAAAQPTYDRPVYVRGLYVAADTTNNSLIMNVRPLKDVISSPFGALTVSVNDQTYYNINGVTFTGSPGLAAVLKLQNAYAYLPIAVYGPPSGNPFGDEQGIQPSFRATQVYVGSSLESSVEDQVTGVIAAISGTTLTMRNAALFDHVGNLGFARSLPVSVSQNTIVSIDGNGSITPGLTSVSVGQAVTVLGRVTEPNATSNDYTPTALDATGSQVGGAQIRLQSTQLFGTLNSGTASGASLRLVAIDRVEPVNVLFAGTGAGGADATAANYVISTPTDESGTAAGTLLKIDGMVNPYGQGPPYFTANAVTSAIQAQLVIEWTATGGNKGGSFNPFSSADTNGLVVNLADANLRAADGSLGRASVQTGPVAIPNSPYYYNLLEPNSTQLTIVYNTQDAQHPPVFAVGNMSGGAYLESAPSGFVSDLQTVSKGNTVAIEKLTAYGQYDPTTGFFSATDITVDAYK